MNKEPIKREGTKFICKCPDDIKEMRQDSGRLYFIGHSGLRYVLQDNKIQPITAPPSSMQ